MDHLNWIPDLRDLLAGRTTSHQMEAPSTAPVGSALRARISAASATRGMFRWPARLAPAERLALPPTPGDRDLKGTWAAQTARTGISVSDPVLHPQRPGRLVAGASPACREGSRPQLRELERQRP